MGGAKGGKAPPRSGHGGLWRWAVALGPAAAAGWAARKAANIPRAVGLPPAVSGDRRLTDRRAGPLSYYVAGDGPPLLLLHSINAAASAYEVRPIFEHAKAARRVYAVDLPGYGFSDRSDRPYTIRLFADAVHDMLDVIAEESGPVPIDGLGVSLSCEFLARAAVERPAAFRSLVLVTPTGFGKPYAAQGSDKPGSREIPGLYRAFTFPLWSQPLFDLLVSRRSIRYFLERTNGVKEIDEGMLDYDWATTHQPGARHAPYAFVSGRLFSREIRSIYARLTLPVWMPHATRGDFSDISQAGWVRARPNWRLEAFPTGALVHVEAPAAFMAALDAFLAHPAPAAPPA